MMFVGLHPGLDIIRVKAEMIRILLIEVLKYQNLVCARNLHVFMYYLIVWGTMARPLDIRV